MKFPRAVASCNRAFLCQGSSLKSHHEHHKAGRAFSTSVGIEELSFSQSDDDEDIVFSDEENPSEDPLNRPLTSEEVKLSIIF